jgi:hypothetical protein
LNFVLKKPAQLSSQDQIHTLAKFHTPAKPVSAKTTPPKTKKASAVAGKLSSLFRGRSWSQGPRGKILWRISSDLTHGRLFGATRPAEQSEDYFFLVVFFFAFLAFFAITLSPPFSCHQFKCRKIVRQRFFNFVSVFFRAISAL